MVENSRTIRRSIAFLIIALALTGCKNCDPVKKTTPATSAVQLTGSGNTYIEITAAATGPTGSGPCKDGVILIAAGNGTQQLLMGSVQAASSSSYDLAGWDGAKWAKRGTGTIDPPPTPSTDAPEGSDNQLARLGNGDLLLMWNGSTRSSLPGSTSLSWWNNWGTSGNVIPDGLKTRFPTGARDGYRAAQVFWRYSCTTGKWSSSPGLLDGGLAQALDDKGVATAGRCVESAPWIRGFDRPELYVDPWGVVPTDNTKQRIYVSTHCSRSDDDSAQVFMSPDSGASWKPSGIRLAGDTPLVMTSTLNGRLFIMQPASNKPVLHWSDDQGASLSSRAGGYDITYVAANPKPGEQARYELGQLASDVVGVGQPNAFTLSLARLGVNSVLAVYPAIEVAKDTSGTPITKQVAAVVWVTTKDKDHDPFVIPIKIIRAQETAGSVLMATFIEDDSPDQKVATNLLYWVETTAPPASATAPVKMLARYLLFNSILSTPERLLSDAAGWERPTGLHTTPWATT